MQRICVTLSDDEHRAVVLAALRARRKTNDYARDILIASVPSAMGVTGEQVQADARRKGKRK